MEKELERRGFDLDLGSDTRRFRHADLLKGLEVDVAMSPIDGTNKWYSELFRLQQAHPAGLKVATPQLLVATKLVAFNHRGGQAPMESHDLEDIVSLLLSHGEVVDDLSQTRAGESALRRYLRFELGKLAAPKGLWRRLGQLAKRP